jgi:hypothetical protein
VQSENTLAWNAETIDFARVIFFKRDIDHSNTQSTSEAMSIEGAILRLDGAPLKL